MKEWNQSQWKNSIFTTSIDSWYRGGDSRSDGNKHGVGLSEEQPQFSGKSLSPNKNRERAEIRRHTDLLLIRI
jgi:hypothetical protein